VRVQIPAKITVTFRERRIVIDRSPKTHPQVPIMTPLTTMRMPCPMIGRNTAPELPPSARWMLI
jgi:hypothetical protein